MSLHFWLILDFKVFKFHPVGNLLSSSPVKKDIITILRRIYNYALRVIYIKILYIKFHYLKMFLPSSVPNPASRFSCF